MFLQMAVPMFFFLPSLQSISALLLSLINLAAFILWIILMIKAFQGDLFKLPIVGEIAQKQIK
jgi:uncharacterized membrane protein